MFETGMSALVLKICSEYAKSLGLNFPPCTQQEINAICQWVDKHTVKDLTMEQNGDSVTFRFVTENETVKEFTFTIPEQKVDVNVLEQLLIGSETVVVERTEDNSKLQVRLAQSVTNLIDGKLSAPVNPAAESVVTLNVNGVVGTKPLSELGGGKLYIHKITIQIPVGVIHLNVYDISSNKITDLTVLTNRYGIEFIGIVTDYSLGGGPGGVDTTSCYVKLNTAQEKVTYIGAFSQDGTTFTTSKSTQEIFKTEQVPTGIIDNVTEL